MVKYATRTIMIIAGLALALWIPNSFGSGAEAEEAGANESHGSHAKEHHGSHGKKHYGSEAKGGGHGRHGKGEDSKFTAMDQDQDGVVSLAEFRMHYEKWITKKFNYIDDNRDGKVTQDEFDDAYHWKSGRAGWCKGSHAKGSHEKTAGEKHHGSDGEKDDHHGKGHR